MLPNENYAVAGIRKSGSDEPDDFLTPPWATRALCEKILLFNSNRKMWDAWEPACGRGYMSATLEEYFETVYSTDKYEYGYGGVQDFLNSPSSQRVAWIITNPPYKYAEEFIREARLRARRGVAMLVRTSFIESVGRYNRLFKDSPPTTVAQFSERVPMVKGRLDKNASTATSYCWLIWNNDTPFQNTHLTINGGSELLWIPPCRRDLEREGDYPSLS